MTKLQITDINFNEHSISLDPNIQRKVQGGINMRLFQLLEQNKKDLVTSHGNIAPNAFMLNIVIDHGFNNQIYQSPS